MVAVGDDVGDGVNVFVGGMGEPEVAEAVLVTGGARMTGVAV
jgi:hypothetical protein